MLKATKKSNLKLRYTIDKYGKDLYIRVVIWGVSQIIKLLGIEFGDSP
jgi:hypothetical protein